VSYVGSNYQMTDLQFLPKPVQQPQIPVWTVGARPHRKSLARSARWDGIIATDMSADDSEGEIDPSAVSNIKEWMVNHHTETSPFDIIVDGVTDGNAIGTTPSKLQPLAEAGATWWIESRWDDQETPETLFERIRQGPPRP